MLRFRSHRKKKIEMIYKHNNFFYKNKQPYVLSFTSLSTRFHFSIKIQLKTIHK